VFGAYLVTACAPSPAPPTPTSAPVAPLAPASIGPVTPVPSATATPTTPTPAATPAAPTASPRAGAPSPTPSPLPGAVTGQAVQVSLEEFKISLDPSTVQAGTVRFVVTNNGTVVHSFEIKGDGIDQKTSNLNPGRSETMQIDLQPGSYDTWCPIDGHKDLGMYAQLTVK